MGDASRFIAAIHHDPLPGMNRRVIRGRQPPHHGRVNAPPAVTPREAPGIAWTHSICSRSRTSALVASAVMRGAVSALLPVGDMTRQQAAFAGAEHPLAGFVLDYSS
ncbi:MAG: hypothetical protein GX882_01250 [Methanomicrobiales archaeon]|nr:hypothetical protein [Methanomicrobiales archaeon]